MNEGMGRPHGRVGIRPRPRGPASFDRTSRCVPATRDRPTLGAVGRGLMTSSSATTVFDRTAASPSGLLDNSTRTSVGKIGGDGVQLESLTSDEQAYGIATPSRWIKRQEFFERCGILDDRTCRRCRHDLNRHRLRTLPHRPDFGRLRQQRGGFVGIDDEHNAIGNRQLIAYGVSFETMAYRLLVETGYGQLVGSLGGIVEKHLNVESPGASSKTPLVVERYYRIRG